MSFGMNAMTFEIKETGLDVNVCWHSGVALGDLPAVIYVRCHVVFGS